MRGILGADIFVALLLFFIFTTGLLLMNTNKTEGHNANGIDENNLPKIQLPKGSSKGLPSSKPKKTVVLSAKKTGEDIQYFVDDKPVKYSDLPAILKIKRISSVKIRFDESISYGHYVSILVLCKQSGITEIINVYKTKK